MRKENHVLNYTQFTLRLRCANQRQKPIVLNAWSPGASYFHISPLVIFRKA